MTRVKTVMIRSPSLLGESGDRAGQQPDLGAQLLHALRPALGDIFGQPGQIGFDVAQMGAQDVVLAQRVFGDRGEPGERRLQFHLVLGQPRHQQLPGLDMLSDRAELNAVAMPCRGDSSPVFRSAKARVRSLAPTLSAPMTPPTERTVSSSP